MRNAYFNVLVVLILFVFTSGCTLLNQNFSNPQPVQKKPIQDSDQEEKQLSAYYFFLESRIHIKNKNFHKAVESLQKALSKDPDSFMLTQGLVQLYLKIDKKEKAFNLTENFVQENPDNVNGLLLFVQLKQETMDEKELLTILNKVLLLDPKNKETFLRLGKIHMDKEDYDQALSLFKKMIKRFPDYYVSWFYLGEVYLAKKQYKLAQNQYLKTIELEHELVQPRFQLIKIYQDFNFNKNKNKILKIYQQILEIEPENYRAKLGIGLHYYKTNMKKKAATLFKELGQEIKNGSRLMMVAVDEYITSKRYQDAIIIFSMMIKGNQNNSTLNFFTAMAYEAAKDFKKAISFYLKIKPEHSQYKKAILSITFLYKELGEPQTAINYLEQKHKELPKDIDITIYLASFYEKEKNYEKALDLMQEGLKAAPDNTSLLFRLGAVQDKAGYKKACLSTMEKIIELDPEDASALNYLGYSYAEQGILLNKALDLIKRANAIKPDDGYITDSLGWVYYKMGDFKKAVKILEKAARLSSFETIISDHLGDAYQKTGQLDKALKTYKKALSNAKDEDKKIVLDIKQKIDTLQKKINE